MVPELTTRFLEGLAPPEPEFSPPELQTLYRFAQVSGIRPEGPGGPPFSLEGRPYLEPLYAESRDRMYYRLVVRKAAQLGMTIHQLIRGAWMVADVRRRLNVAFMFPTKDAVEDLSATRFKPMFQGSGRMLRLAGAGGLSRVSSVRFGVSLMRFRGLNTGVSVDSFPTDALLYDEVRLMSLEMILRADNRVNGSAYRGPNGEQGLIQRSSTAGFPGQDIDYFFQKSDQRYFMTRCPNRACLNHAGFCMYESFETWLSTVDFDTQTYRCPLCKTRIEDPMNGYWEALQPGEPVVGFAFSGTMLGNSRLPKLLENYAIKVLDGKNPGDFYNSDLGIPHADPDAVVVTPAVFDACRQIREYRWPPEGPGSANRCFGIDQRDTEKHLIIAEWGPDGRVYPVHLQILEASGEEAIGATVALLKRWGCSLGVIDEGPSYDYAKGVAERMPRGVTWLARYVEEALQPLEWADQSEKPSLEKSHAEAKWPYWVRIDRYKHLSQALTLFVNHRVVVPTDFALKEQTLRRAGRQVPVSVGLEWREHLANIARVRIPRRTRHPETGELIDRGEYRMTWRHLAVEPHFAHAWGYVVAALMRRSGGTLVIRAPGPQPEALSGRWVDQLPPQMRPEGQRQAQRCATCAFFTDPGGGGTTGLCHNNRLAAELNARAPMATATTAEGCRYWRAKS